MLGLLIWFVLIDSAVNCVCVVFGLGWVLIGFAVWVGYCGFAYLVT